MINKKEKKQEEADKVVSMKQLAETFYMAIDEFVNKAIDSFIKENDLYRFVVGIVIRKQRNDTFIIDIGDTTISNIVNKSNCIIEVGDTVTILDRYGSNFRNSFILCRNGNEQSLEARLSDKIEQLELEVAALKGGTEE